MPELVFKGKEFVYNHHLTVPYRPLTAAPSKSVGSGSLDDNLIVHGDNLHALKALLPRFAGKVDCIFIDPPYNTGNESWNYNDNVNSPMMREWFSSNPVNREDMLRHDKWCCMMWPRLCLLSELLADDGSLWVTLDDNEVAHARTMLDELFGEDRLQAMISWQKRYTRSNNTDGFTSVVDHLLVYAKSDLFAVNLQERTEEADSRFTNPDNDERGPWKPASFLNQLEPEKRGNLCYPITNPKTGKVTIPTSKAWRVNPAAFRMLAEQGRLYWGVEGNRDVPDIKVFLSEVKQGLAPTNMWDFRFAGSTDDANRQLTQIMGSKALETIKPIELVQKVVEHSTQPGALVLDSFAGSGTTAHAVLALNRSNPREEPRRFILVECEDYADTLTAERTRRVINGYAFEGTQREELMAKRLSWTVLKKGDALVGDVEAKTQFYGPSFDSIEVKIQDDTLKLVGVRKVAETAPGLGGSFTYCELGEPLDEEGLLSGENLPSWEALADYQFHTATGESRKVSARSSEGIMEWHAGESREYCVWLVYRPEAAFLKSREAALTLELAERIAEAKPGKRNLVFAPARFAPNKLLLPLGVEYAPLPFSLYRVEKA